MEASEGVTVWLLYIKLTFPLGLRLERPVVPARLDYTRPCSPRDCTPPTPRSRAPSRRGQENASPSPGTPPLELLRAVVWPSLDRAREWIINYAPRPPRWLGVVPGDKPM